VSSDWKTQLAEHPVVASIGWKYDAREFANNPCLCPEFIEPPETAPPVLPWDDDEPDCA
jgi:hypothetical protein